MRCSLLPGVPHAVSSHAMPGENDQKALLAMNNINSQGLQFLQDILPKTEATMTLNEKILDNNDFKDLPLDDKKKKVFPF